MRTVLILCSCVFIAFGTPPPAWGEYGSDTKNYQMISVHIKGLKCFGPHEGIVRF